MTRTLSAIAALAMTAGTLALAVPAHAAPGAAAEEVVSISLEGLDYSDPADAARIDRRIRTAAQDLCGSKLIQPTRMREQAAACEAALIADARNSVQLASAKEGTPLRLALRVR